MCSDFPGIVKIVEPKCMQFSETQMPARERSPNFYGVGGRAGGLQKSWTQPFHPPRKNLASATAGALACQKIAYIFFSKILAILELFHLHPVKIWRALPRGHLRVRKMYKFHTCYSEIFAILRPFHPPHKNFASATAGALACQKLHTFYFQLFCNPPAFHPPSKNFASYRGGTCVSENCIRSIPKILAILELFHLHPVKI